MNDSLTALIAIALAAFVFIPIVYGLWMLKVNILNPDGRGCEKKTARTLKRFALLRGFKVFSDVQFSHKGIEFHVENMLVGHFGILMINTLGGRGAYYGQLDGKTWQFVTDKKRESLPNLATLQDDTIMALRGVLSQNKVYSVPMEALIVLTNRSKKTQMHITNDGRIFLPGKLKPYLDKTKFEKDAGVDIGKIAEVIGQIAKDYCTL